MWLADSLTVPVTVGVTDMDCSDESVSVREVVPEPELVAETSELSVDVRDGVWVTVLVRRRVSDVV